MLREKDNPNKIVWSEERAKIKALPFKEKIQYIWMYFKIPIIIALFVIGFGTFLIVRIATNIPDNWLTVTFANTTARAGTGSEIWKDFTEYAGYDLKQKKVEFNAESYFDYLQNQARGNAYYNAFVSLADAGEIDAITMSKDSLAALGQSGALPPVGQETGRIEGIVPLQGQPCGGEEGEGDTGERNQGDQREQPVGHIHVQDLDGGCQEDREQDTGVREADRQAHRFR